MVKEKKSDSLRLNRRPKKMHLFVTQLTALPGPDLLLKVIGLPLMSNEAPRVFSSWRSWSLKILSSEQKVSLPFLEKCSFFLFKFAPLQLFIIRTWNLNKNARCFFGCNQYPTLHSGAYKMPRSPYKSNKRQKEIDRKEKQELKRQRRIDKKSGKIEHTLTSET